jgi:hypothetical protein
MVSRVTVERETAFRSETELREVLDRLLTAANDDDRLGPILRAANVRARLSFADFGLFLNVASAEDEAGYVDWSFAKRAPWEPKVRLRMESPVANSWLQGRESLAIAIARGHVRCSCDPKSVLFFVPVARLLAEPYRRLIESDYEHLRLA